MDEHLAGTVAGILSTLAFVPQAWQVWKTRRADDISSPTYLGIASASLLWIFHGVDHHDWPLSMTNACILMLALLILGMKHAFYRRAIHQGTVPEQAAEQIQPMEQADDEFTFRQR